MEIFFFSLFAFLAVLCGINVVLQTHPISSALSLVGVMGSLAMLYLGLGAEFIAMAQIIVYAGAIMVLFIFVIMLLNAGAEGKQGKASWTAQLLGGPGLLALFVMLCIFASRWFPTADTVRFGDFQVPDPQHVGKFISGGDAQQIGYALFTDYLLPFEVTSLLILIAIIGAIVLARKEID
jgi:NADH-quinone oxidoreductase subunit J